MEFKWLFNGGNVVTIFDGIGSSLEMLECFLFKILVMMVVTFLKIFSYTMWSVSSHSYCAMGVE